MPMELIQILQILLNWIGMSAIYNIFRWVQGLQDILALFTSAISKYYSAVLPHCVLKKHSVARNSLGPGLFYVVNVLCYFKIA